MKIIKAMQSRAMCPNFGHPAITSPLNIVLTTRPLLKEKSFNLYRVNIIWKI